MFHWRRITSGALKGDISIKLARGHFHKVATTSFQPLPFSRFTCYASRFTFCLLTLLHCQLNRLSLFTPWFAFVLGLIIPSGPADHTITVPEKSKKSPAPDAFW